MATATATEKGKKIKGYLPLHLVEMVKTMARKERVRPSVVIGKILAEKVRLPRYHDRQQIEKSSKIPYMRMEMSFWSGEEFQKKWDYYKKINRIEKDTQLMKLLLQLRYDELHDRNTGQEFFDFGK